MPIGTHDEKFLNFPLVSKIMETESQNNNYILATAILHITSKGTE